VSGLWTQRRAWARGLALAAAALVAGSCAALRYEPGVASATGNASATASALAVADTTSTQAQGASITPRPSITPLPDLSVPSRPSPAIGPIAQPASPTILQLVSPSLPRIASPTTRPPITPLPTPPPSPIATATALALCGAPANPWNYTFCGGSQITTPPTTFCGVFSCIASFSNGHGYVVQCADGLYSLSGGISGSCSQHGGTLRTLYAP
jgi:hypothetical protein